MLAGKDSKPGLHFAYILPCEGTNHPFCVKEMTAQLLASEFQRRSDGTEVVTLELALGDTDCKSTTCSGRTLREATASGKRGC
eukprot:3811513-Amphidinium_carterae.2